MQQNIELLISDEQANYELVYQNDRLQLQWLGRENFLPLFVDLPKKARLDKSNLLLKAIGKSTSHVTDLTAGLGVDAMTLAICGKNISCLERCAPIALLLFDGLQRNSYLAATRMRLNFADSVDWLAKNQTELGTVYIDAMFAGKKKTAKSSKSMQILRAIAGDDADAPVLLTKALQSGAEKVVVKHYDNAPVFEQKPSFQYHGKTVRFDVYI